MQDIALQSGWETLLLAAPFVGMVLVGVFRLDTIMAAPKTDQDARQWVPGNDTKGRVLLSDPDGRPWNDAHNPASTAPSD